MEIAPADDIMRLALLIRLNLRDAEMAQLEN